MWRSALFESASAALVVLGLSGCSLWLTGSVELAGLASAALTCGLMVAVGGLGLLHLRTIRWARRDIERRVSKRVEDMRRAEELLLAAERLTHLGHWEQNLVTGAGFWSSEINRILGRARGPHPLDLTDILAAVHPEDRDEGCTARILASAGVKPYDIQFRIFRAGGEIRHVHARAEVLRDDRGEPVKLIGTILDITDRVFIEQRLRESEEKYRRIFEATGDALFLVDSVTGLIAEANGAAARIYGYDRAELTGMPWQRIEAHGLSADTYVRHRRRDGTDIFAELSLAEVDFNGQPGAIIAVRDITARKKVEINLRLLTRAIEQTPLSVVITDREGKIEYVNPHFVTATGYSIEEIKGENPRIFRSGYTSLSEYHKMWEAISCGKVWHGEFHNRMKNGELHWESASIGPVRDEDGEITHFVAVKEDITRRKLAEIELLAAKERAEAASISKSQFLATISHELRTPLNAVLGFSEVIRDGARDVGDPERFANYARHIHANGTHLLGLINDLLDLAKIEAGKFELHDEFVDIEEVVYDAMEMVRSRAESGKLTLTRETPSHLPLMRGDDRAMRHVLINLLSNAVKFTPETGSVTVRAGIDDNGLLAISVIDTGIGMAEEDIPKALEPFGQIDNALSRRHDGTGLGLSLCRSLVEMHGGHLEIVSTVGIGTAVTVRLPRARVVVAEMAVLAQAVA
ncbi:MAG: PAS domain S-box protein [Rhodospirillaceae bacterium]